MGLLLDSKISREIKSARQRLRITQSELCEKAKVSLRTVQEIEWGRRQNYNESTLIRICRALNLDYQKLLNMEGEKRKEFISPGFLIIALIALTITLIVISVITYNKQSIMAQRERQRVDWIKLLEADKMRHEAITPPWNIPNGQLVNYVDLKQLAKVNEVLTGEIKWSYHYEEGSTPEIFLSAYTEWKPNKEIRIFHGILKGDSSLTRKFKIKCPPQAGVYNIRFFYASSFAPISSYYGHPLPSQVTSPACTHYYEMGMEVVK